MPIGYIIRSALCHGSLTLRLHTRKFSRCSHNLHAVFTSKIFWRIFPVRISFGLMDAILRVFPQPLEAARDVDFQISNFSFIVIFLSDSCELCSLSRYLINLTILNNVRINR
jgi:hypothetical protein